MPKTWIILGLAASVALAGCMADEADESSGSDPNARHFTVDVPDGATQVHVDVTGRATGGEPDVTVLVEDAGGGNLATETFSVAGETQRRVTVDAAGHDRMVVTVRVVDGDAELDVAVSATVPSGAPVVIVQERVVIVQVAPPRTTTTTPATTTPATTTPPTEPTPPPTTTTPPPTNGTNGTNETNGTG